MKYLSPILAFVAFLLLNACAKPTFRLIDKPIIFDEERKCIFRP